MLLNMNWKRKLLLKTVVEQMYTSFFSSWKVTRICTLYRKVFKSLLFGTRLKSDILYR